MVGGGGGGASGHPTIMHWLKVELPGTGGGGGGGSGYLQQSSGNGGGGGVVIVKYKIGHTQSTGSSPKATGGAISLWW